MSERRRFSLFCLSIIALLGFGAGEVEAQSPNRCDPTAAPCFQRAQKILFSSTRDNPTVSPLLAAQIYMMDPDGANPVRLTETPDSGNAFASVSPDGKKIVFDSNRNRTAGEPLNTSDLFVMNIDGTEQTLLTRGSSATWSVDSKNIAFHASASGTGLPIRPDPGAPTSDSDLFLLNIDDGIAWNLTNSPGQVDQDPTWSPDGLSIAFTRHPEGAVPAAQVYVIDAGGTTVPQQLTFFANGVEPRAPAWSPDGSRILFMCRLGDNGTYELCVMNADGSNLIRLTNNLVGDLAPQWSPDGLEIVFHRPRPDAPLPGNQFELFVMNADGTAITQLTNTPGLNGFPSWGEVLVPGR